MNDIEKLKFLTLRRLERRPLSHRARSQSLYLLRYQKTQYSTQDPVKPPQSTKQSFLYADICRVIEILSGGRVSLRVNPAEPDLNGVNKVSGEQLHLNNTANAQSKSEYGSTERNLTVLCTLTRQMQIRHHIDIQWCLYEPNSFRVVDCPAEDLLKYSVSVIYTRVDILTVDHIHRIFIRT